MQPVAFFFDALAFGHIAGDGLHADGLSEFVNQPCADFEYEFLFVARDEREFVLRLRFAFEFALEQLLHDFREVRLVFFERAFVQHFVARITRQQLARLVERIQPPLQIASEYDVVGVLE